ncbi:hypothetical protein AWRI3579_g3691 [Hanseniaspora osmophila]|uniref:Uncharacterized protein n=1 Tax=Hanseniaspora osmophila TaxID=56408 RepID=A0A1E5R4X1_9ASCO|nr:hypothetical protein AWRI3579_g3691 [Hanseniaspora osmophila]
MPFPINFRTFSNKANLPISLTNVSTASVKNNEIAQTPDGKEAEATDPKAKVSKNAQLKKALQKICRKLCSKKDRKMELPTDLTMGTQRFATNDPTMTLRGPSSRTGPSAPLDIFALFALPVSPDTDDATSVEITETAPQPRVSRAKKAKRVCCKKIKTLFNFKKRLSSNCSVSNIQALPESAAASFHSEEVEEKEYVAAEEECVSAEEECVSAEEACVSADEECVSADEECVSANDTQQLRSILKTTSKYDQPSTPVLPERESMNIALEPSVEALLISYKNALSSLEAYELSLVTLISRKEQPLDWRSLRTPVPQDSSSHTPKTVPEWKLVHLKAQYLLCHLNRQAAMVACRDAQDSKASPEHVRYLGNKWLATRLPFLQSVVNLNAKTDGLETLQPGLVNDFDPHAYFNSMEKPAQLFSTIINESVLLPFSVKQMEQRVDLDYRNEPKPLSDHVFANEKYRLMLAELNYFKFLLQKKCSSCLDLDLRGLKCFPNLVSWGIVSP